MPRHTRADSRAELLAAAQALFNARGYHGTSLADIAREAGFSKAAVLYHFATKEALLQDLLAPALTQAQEVLDAAERLPAARRPRFLLTCLADLMVAHREVATLLVTQGAAMREESQLHTLEPLQRRILAALQSADPTVEDRIGAWMFLIGSGTSLRAVPEVGVERWRQALIALGARMLGLAEDDDVNDENEQNHSDDESDGTPGDRRGPDGD